MLGGNCGTQKKSILIFKGTNFQVSVKPEMKIEGIHCSISKCGLENQKNKCFQIRLNE